jgi:hypothetical protein
MRPLVIFAISILRSARALFRSREEQAIVELALRQQLAVYAQDRPRPRLSPLDRALLGRTLPPMAAVARIPRRRSTRDRDPLASSEIPTLLAFDLYARPWPSSYL